MSKCIYYGEYKRWMRGCGLSGYTPNKADFHDLGIKRFVQYGGLQLIDLFDLPKPIAFIESEGFDYLRHQWVRTKKECITWDDLPEVCNRNQTTSFVIKGSGGEKTNASVMPGRTVFIEIPIPEKLNCVTLRKRIIELSQNENLFAALMLIKDQALGFLKNPTYYKDVIFAARGGYLPLLQSGQFTNHEARDAMRRIYEHFDLLDGKPVDEQLGILKLSYQKFNELFEQSKATKAAEATGVMAWICKGLGISA